MFGPRSELDPDYDPFERANSQGQARKYARQYEARLRRLLTETTAERDAALAQVAAQAKCSTCGGDPHSHPSGNICICGNGTRQGEVDNLRLSVFNLYDQFKNARTEAAQQERERLDDWLNHGPECPAPVMSSTKQQDRVCTCGLAAALRTEPAS